MRARPVYNVWGEDMRFSETMRAAVGAEGPIWARNKKRKASAAPLVNVLVTLLALIGALTLVLSIVGTAVIAFAIKALFGLRPNTEEEREGLDVTDHEEKGYIY